MRTMRMHYIFSKPVQVLGWMIFGLAFYAAVIALIYLVGGAVWSTVAHA